MLAHYGYRDGSGEYFVAVDAAACTSCGRCAADCPSRALEMTDILVGLDEKSVAAVREASRNTLKEACAGCDHAGRAPCETACAPKAIRVTWKQG